MCIRICHLYVVPILTMILRQLCHYILYHSLISSLTIDYGQRNHDLRPPVALVLSINFFCVDFKYYFDSFEGLL